MTLVAKQIHYTSLLFPLLPPNLFRLINDSYDVIYHKLVDARIHYRNAMHMPINSRKHSKYVDGALYTKLFEENVEYIRLCPGDYLNIAVTLEDGSQTTINMFREPIPKHNEHLMNCRNLGIFLKDCQANTARRNRRDLGKMFILGSNKLGNGTIGNIKLTEKKGMSPLLRKVILSSNNYYSDLGFDKVIRSIANKRKYKNHHLMRGSFVSSIVCSVNLINSSHLDVYDTTMSVVTWTTDCEGEVLGWYFIFPNLTCDGEKCLVLEIQDGVSIIWDAAKIHHCSTRLGDGCNYNSFGTYFGA